MINDYEATKPMTADAIPISFAGITNAGAISTLNGLIETCRDGQDGFMTAAQDVERGELKALFYEYAHQRTEFMRVLQQLVRSLGGEPENTGSLTAALHRGWMGVKAVVTGKDEEAVLSECERGEDQAKEAYEEALKTELPASIYSVLAQQSQAVLAAHNRVRELRNAESKKTGTMSGLSQMIISQNKGVPEN